MFIIYIVEKTKILCYIVNMMRNKKCFYNYITCINKFKNSLISNAQKL